MRAERPRVRRSALVASALTLLVACGRAEGPDELCEEAVLKLGACCPPFDAKLIVCSENYYPRSTPHLDEYDSRCVLKHSCEDIRTYKACPYITHFVVGGVDWPDQVVHVFELAAHGDCR